jgi:8-oxo-dGTP diphosphatase
MKFKIILKEERVTPKISVLKQLEPYSQDPSYYVTFTDLEKVGVNPNNRFATPIGVYAYSLKDLWNDWVSGDRFFGDDRKYVNVLRLNTNKLFDFQNYTNYQKDFQFLKDIYQRDYQATTGISFEDYIETLKQKATLYEHNSEAAEIWDIIQSMLQINDRQAASGLVTKRSTILWNKVMREMGYDAIVDKGSNIHLLQSSQSIFLTPKSYEVVDRFVNKTYRQTMQIQDKWGTDEQPFWRPGVNPTIDIVVFKNDGQLKVLLIKRSATSKADPNKYAFPGGFHDTNQPKGQPWSDDRESKRQAAFRELAEETGLWIPTLNDIMQLVGSYQGGGRDPRDNQESWSKTTAFAVMLPEEFNNRTVSGRDDAQEADWIPLEQAAKMQLAFDHNKILEDALTILNLKESKRNYRDLWKSFLNEITYTVHHGSTQDFVVFNPEKSREFGFHFGTLESAKHRNAAFVKKYEITFNNPLKLDDVGFWESASVLDNMTKKGYVNQQQSRQLLQDINKQASQRAKVSGTSLRYEKNEVLKDVLESMGYDSIVYENRGEAGDTAYIIFRPDQAKYIETMNEAKKKAYKPNFSKEKEQGLHGWFARNDGKGWVNCRTGGPCGRDNADKGGKYPACRPTKAQCKSAGKGPLRKKKSSKAISWTKKKKKD